jgi:hypothetical protein
LEFFEQAVKSRPFKAKSEMRFINEAHQCGSCAGISALRGQVNCGEGTPAPHNFFLPLRKKLRKKQAGKIDSA